jgi:hypothetical protein
LRLKGDAGNRIAFLAFEMNNMDRVSFDSFAPWLALTAWAGS